MITERALNTLAAAVTDWSEDKSKREALVQLGRSVLIKWLLSRALDDSNKLEQAEAEHALLNLLADGELVCMHFTVAIAAGSSGLAQSGCLLRPGTHSCHCTAWVSLPYRHCMANIWICKRDELVATCACSHNSFSCT